MIPLRIATPLACCLFATACEVYDDGLLPGAQTGFGDRSAPQDGPPAAEPNDAGLAPPLGPADAGRIEPDDAGETTAVAAWSNEGTEVENCMFVLDPDPICPIVCPEDCDGEDDDCDGEVDEDPAGELCPVPNATASCNQGSCELVQCEAGYQDCDGDPENGCEVSPDDVDNCGGCGIACELEGAEAECRSGVCLALGCSPGYQDCDGDMANGCEALNTTTHCGACFAGCGDAADRVVEATCSGQQCVLQCEQGYGDCDGDPANGCETSLNSDDNCGACDAACSIDNALDTCWMGQCRLLRCHSGWGDCDNDSDNGCETRLDSEHNCGACGRSCSGATPVCSGGICSAAACEQPDTANCDADGTSCEVELDSDLENCGACGAACAFEVGTPHASALACQAGECRPTCDPLWADCNGDHRDGCETKLTTLDDCGACGVACAIAHAEESCAQGTCRVTQCDPDWGDCDGDGLSCERPLGSARDCQGCGLACELPNAVASCRAEGSSHACAIATCADPSFADCDGLVDNGCERDVRPPSEGGLGPCLPEPDCLALSYAGHDYFVCPSSRNRSQASSYCELQRDGGLVSIGDEAELDFVVSQISQDVWVGAGALGASGNGGPGATCTALRADGSLAHSPCMQPKPFVCEVAAK